MTSTSLRALIWRSRIAEWWANAWRWVLMAAAAAAVVYILLEQNVQNAPMTAISLSALIIAAVITRSQPLAIALVAMPGLFIVQRVGLGGGDLSVSDVALAAAFGCALLLGERPYSLPLRRMLWLNLLFQFTTLFTVIVNPFPANTVEWFHAWLLVSGALVVGWALGAGGQARLALNLIVATGGVLAVVTLVHGILQYARGDFAAVYLTWPFEMHKNFVGTVLAFVAVIVYINPDWFGWPKRSAAVVFWLVIAAVLMTQSRQALIGLVIAVLVAVFRRRATGRSRFMLLLTIPAAILVVTMVADQIASQNQYNSVFQRLNWFREVYHLWRESPVFGHGLRYWYNDTTLFQPPQAELEVLVTAGVVGLIGFFVMWLGMVVVLWRVDPRFGTLAVAVLLSRLTQGQFDLFWTAVQVSIPFVIAGVCLGALAREERGDAASFRIDTRASTERLGLRST
ncbi:O-antigen ligase [Agromyces ramosus]|uniref:O-antigen ligase n=1 Tax=Agromyces ramosus TaxID=33879 RepID=A0A4Q7M664_9MICO|nr:O-antigen ligase family protein [Agromyces ramosus]RZS63476.1 O-antigen ligase [Agromyces ramosus]